MTRENVEIVKRLFEAFDRGDMREGEKYLDDEVVLDARGMKFDLVEIASVYHGTDAVRDFWRTWLPAWTDMRAEVKWVKALGDRVIAWVLQRQVGRTSGIPVELAYGWDFLFRDGRIVRLAAFRDERKALKAIGLAHDNVEVVRRSLEAITRRDAESMRELTDEDEEFISAVAAIDEATYRGNDAWTTYLARMGEAWEEWRMEDAKLFDVGGDQVVGVVRIIARGEGSGVPLDQSVGLVWTLRNGKLWRGRSYIDPAEALEAVGLSSWPEDGPRNTPS